MFVGREGESRTIPPFRKRVKYQVADGNPLAPKSMVQIVSLGFTPFGNPVPRIRPVGTR